MGSRDADFDAVAQRFDRQAASYRDDLAPVLHGAGRRLVAALAGDARRVLDLGCGVGSLLPLLQETFPRATVLGADGSPGVLALRPPGTRAAVMDAAGLALGADSQDVVISAFMLFLMADPRLGMREARRVLRPDGRLGVLTWAGELESEAMSICKACLDAHDPGGAGPTPLPGLGVTDSPENLAASLAAAGFEGVHAWQEELASEVDLEHLIRLKVGFGRSRTRFESMDARVRSAYLRAVRRDLAGLGSETTTLRAPVVFATAGVKMAP